MKKIIFLIIINIFLAGCFANYSSITKKTTKIAGGQGLSPKIYQTKNFKIFTLQKITDPNKNVRIYFEGDGKVFINRNVVSPNPTPTSYFLINLIAEDTYPNIVYIARPCQFVEDKKCQSGQPQRYWTRDRFSKEVIDSINEVMEEFFDYNLELVGYSGGAVIAKYAAVNSNDLYHNVINIRTIAGNLDNKKFAKIHKVPTLREPKDSDSLLKKLQNIPQIHFVGSSDETVPAEIAQTYFKKLFRRSCTKIITVDSATHSFGWQEKWQELLSIKPSCANDGIRQEVVNVDRVDDDYEEPEEEEVKKPLPNIKLSLTSPFVDPSVINITGLRSIVPSNESTPKTSSNQAISKPSHPNKEELVVVDESIVEDKINKENPLLHKQQSAPVENKVSSKEAPKIQPEQKADSNKGHIDSKSIKQNSFAAAIFGFWGLKNYSNSKEADAKNIAAIKDEKEVKSKLNNKTATEPQQNEDLPEVILPDSLIELSDNLDKSSELSFSDKKEKRELVKPTLAAGKEEVVEEKDDKKFKSKLDSKKTAIESSATLNHPNNEYMLGLLLDSAMELSDDFNKSKLSNKKEIDSKAAIELQPSHQNEESLYDSGLIDSLIELSNDMDKSSEPSFINKKEIDAKMNNKAAIEPQADQQNEECSYEPGLIDSLIELSNDLDKAFRLNFGNRKKEEIEKPIISTEQEKVAKKEIAKEVKDKDEKFDTESSDKKITIELQTALDQQNNKYLLETILIDSFLITRELNDGLYKSSEINFSSDQEIEERARAEALDEQEKIAKEAKIKAEEMAKKKLANDKKSKRKKSEKRKIKSEKIKSNAKLKKGSDKTNSKTLGKTLKKEKKEKVKKIHLKKSSKISKGKKHKNKKKRN